MKAAIRTQTSILFLAFVVLGIYYPAIFSPLNSVDDPGMYSYLLNTDSFKLHDIFFPGALGNYYRPVLIVSYLMDKYVWGLEESFMHLENIFLHLLNTMLVFAVARKASLRQQIDSAVVPLAAALFFAVHPINTESVNWIAGRTDLLAGFFLLLSVLLLLHRPENYVIISLSALCMLAACLAKETAIFFLPAAIIFPVFASDAETKPWRRWRMIRASVPHLLLFSAAGVGYFIFRFSATGHHDEGVSTVLSHVAGSESQGVLSIFELSLRAAGFYLKKIFLPFPLNFGISHVSDIYVPLGIVLLVIILWLLIRPSFMAFFFICAAFVGSSALIVPLVNQSWTPFAERYLYIPSGFFVVGMALAIYRWEKRAQYQQAVTAALLVAAVFAVYGTASRTLVWQSNLALYQDTLRKSPDFVPAQNEIANALYAKGKNRQASALLLSMKIPEGTMSPQYGWVSKAAACENMGDLAGARAFLMTAMATPGKHEIEIIRHLLKLIDLEVKNGKSDNATVYAERVRLLSRLYEISRDPFYQYRLGLIHVERHQLKPAQAAFAVAAAQGPENSYYRKPALKLSESLLNKD